MQHTICQYYIFVKVLVHGDNKIALWKSCPPKFSASMVSILHACINKSQFATPCHNGARWNSLLCFNGDNNLSVVTQISSTSSYLIFIIWKVKIPLYHFCNFNAMSIYLFVSTQNSIHNQRASYLWTVMQSCPKSI